MADHDPPEGGGGLTVGWPAPLRPAGGAGAGPRAEAALVAAVAEALPRADGAGLDLAGPRAAGGPAGSPEATGSSFPPAGPVRAPRPAPPPHPAPAISPRGSPGHRPRTPPTLTGRRGAGRRGAGPRRRTRPGRTGTG